MANFRASGQVTRDDLYQMIRFNDLASEYRVFAIPKTVLTKGSADAMGKWLAYELKKGSHWYGDLLKGELFDEGQLLGLKSEWDDWLAYEANQTVGSYRSAHF